MEVELGGQRALLLGNRNLVAVCIAEMLETNGAHVVWDDSGSQSGEPCEILVVSHELTATEPQSDLDLLKKAQTYCARMAERGPGRIVHVMSALGLVAMRRHPDLSVAAAAIASSVRVQAMQLAPNVLVNAVAAGLIGDAAGDPAMLSHVPLGRPGSAQHVANAVLFLLDPANTYTTGQVLAVDGGWTTGYGRNF